jgi:squalene cyclase
MLNLTVLFSRSGKTLQDDFKAMYRHISKGAWTFSMQDHGWQVSDCTAEGLKVMPTLNTFILKLHILKVRFKGKI